MLQARAGVAAARPARRTCAWPAASRSTAWRTASCCARGTSTTSGSSPRRAMPAARSARRCVAYHLHKGKPRTLGTGTRRACAAAISGRSSASDDIEERLRSARRRLRRARRRVDRSPRPRQLARRGQGARLVPGPHGVRPARARRPLDPRRRALAGDAEDAEPQGQVPRVVPAVRAVGAARGRAPTASSSTATAPTCCWSPTWPRSTASR